MNRLSALRGRSGQGSGNLVTSLVRTICRWFIAESSTRKPAPPTSLCNLCRMVTPPW